MAVMHPVNSDNLTAVGYDEASRELFIRFKTATYVYANVPQQVYIELMNASSHGKYFAQHIKHNYQYRRLG